MSFTTVTESMIEVMQAYVSGQPIEYRRLGEKVWVECSSPVWDWVHNSYRAKPLTPDYIDWTHIAPRFQFCARDNDGEAYLFVERPVTGDDVWCGIEATQIDKFWQGIFTKGDVPWNESLIERN